MYPSRASFLTDETYGVWWVVNRSTGQDVCAINAQAWLRAVRSALGLAPASVWDATLSAALSNAASVMDREQPGSGWDAIVRALEARVPSPTAFLFATWFAFYRPNRLRFDALDLGPSSIEMPALGQTIAAPRVRTSDATEGDRLACFRPSSEAPPALLTAAERRDVESASSIGVRVRPGEPTDQAPDELDLGPSAIPPWALALGGGLLLVTAAVFVSTTRMGATPGRRSSGRRLARANPHAWLGATS